MKNKQKIRMDDVPACELWFMALVKQEDAMILLNHGSYDYGAVYSSIYRSFDLLFLASVNQRENGHSSKLTRMDQTYSLRDFMENIKKIHNPTQPDQKEYAPLVIKCSPSCRKCPGCGACSAHPPAHCSEACCYIDYACPTCGAKTIPASCDRCKRCGYKDDEKHNVRSVALNGIDPYRLHGDLRGLFKDTAPYSHLNENIIKLFDTLYTLRNEAQHGFTGGYAHENTHERLLEIAHEIFKVQSKTFSSIYRAIGDDIRNLGACYQHQGKSYRPCCYYLNEQGKDLLNILESSEITVDDRNAPLKLFKYPPKENPYASLIFSTVQEFFAKRKTSISVKDGLSSLSGLIKKRLGAQGECPPEVSKFVQESLRIFVKSGFSENKKKYIPASLAKARKDELNDLISNLAKNDKIPTITPK